MIALHLYIDKIANRAQSFWCQDFILTSSRFVAYKGRMRHETGRPERPYHHGDLRNALLRAGLQILDKEGIGAITLRAVAARAGVSHAAPAHHFGNVKGLMTALAAIAFNRLHASIQAAVDAAPKLPAEQIRAAGKGYVRFAEENPGLFRLMFNSSLLDHADPGLQRAGDRAYQQLLDIAAPATALLGGRGEDDVTAVALQMWCTVHGFAHLLLEGQIASPRDGGSPASRLPDVADLLLGSIKTRKARRR
jgi:AcrR family transcriptional regulator